MAKPKKSLAEKLAELSTATPKDYDPENLDDTFQASHAGDSDAGSDDEDNDNELTGREHYVAMGKSQLRSKQFLMDDPKYKGKKSSRKAALDMEDEDEDEDEEMEAAGEDDDTVEDDEDSNAGSDDFESDVASGDDLDDEEDLMAGLDRDGSDDDEEDEDDEEEDGEEEDDDQEGSDDGDDDDGYGDFSSAGITSTPKEMQEELQKIQQEEKDLLRSMTKSVSDDVEKGAHVKAQMGLWETLLDARIRFQKPVSLINTFPQPDMYDEFMTNESAESLEEAKHDLRSFIDTLITLRTGLLRNMDDVKVPKTNKRTLDDLEDEEARNLDDDAPYRNNTLEKWSNKVQIASGIPLNKKFKAMNQGIMTQISQTMADKERLLKRTQLKRSEYRVLGTASKSEEEDKDEEEEGGAEKVPSSGNLDAHLSNHDEEIFDDGDFYQQLLRELIES
ncbi:hypothetical protein BGW38_005989, partial [Lunasporangiospora selenospora]